MAEMGITTQRGGIHTNWNEQKRGKKTQTTTKTNPTMENGKIMFRLCRR